MAKQKLRELYRNFIELLNKEPNTRRMVLGNALIIISCILMWVPGFPVALAWLGWLASMIYWGIYIRRVYKGYK